MFNTIKITRLQNKLLNKTYIYNTKKINTWTIRHQLPLTTQILNQSTTYTNCTKPCPTFTTNYSTIPPQKPPPTNTLNAIQFEDICEETLDHLTEYFEELVELDPSIKEADISYSSGVLTVSLGERGTYVINKQSPNKQIWLSSPTSGPKRFDFDLEGKYWVYSHTGQTLHQLLQEEMPKIFKVDNIDFSRCCYSKL